MNIVALNFKKYEKVEQLSAWDATGSATFWLPGSGFGSTDSDLRGKISTKRQTSKDV